MNVSKQEEVGRDATRRGWKSGVALVCFGLALRAMLPLSAQPPLNNGSGAAGTAEPTPVSESGSKAGAITTNAVGTITGEGTTGNIAKFTGTNAIGNSVIVESGGKIGIGTDTPTSLLTVKGTESYVIQSNNTSTGAAIYGTSNGIALRGKHVATSGASPAILGETASTSTGATGVQGIVLPTAPGASSVGVRGINNSTSANGSGVAGSHAGSGAGVYGGSVSGNAVYGASSSGIGVRGETNSTFSNAAGVLGIINSSSPGGYSAGVRGINNSSSINGIGVYGSQATTGWGVYGHAPGGLGIYGKSTTGNGAYGQSESGIGVYAQSNSNYGVKAVSASNYGVRGESGNSTGVSGASTGGTGVGGTSSTGNGVRGISTSNDGVAGITGSSGHAGVAGSNSGAGTGVYGESVSGYAAYFVGDVHVTGTLSKGGGSFKIDHPLDPANKYLSHSFVESPDMMNIYNGNVTTDAKGFANVTLPDYFKALNSEYRYQLTVIGTFAQAIVAHKIDGHGRFVIRTDKPKVEVSWQVTGIRKDAYAKAHPIRVSQNKIGKERGAYLHPELFGQPKKKRITSARPPLAAQRFSATR